MANQNQNQGGDRPDQKNNPGQQGGGDRDPGQQRQNPGQDNPGQQGGGGRDNNQNQNPKQR